MGAGVVGFEEGESQEKISVEVLADEVNDPGEAIVLSFGKLPEAVIPGDPSSTQVNFNQQRTAEQFSRTLEVMLAVVTRSMAESAQTAIEGRFERHRQWSRMGQAGGGSSGPTTGGGLRVPGPGAGEALIAGLPASSHSNPDHPGLPPPVAVACGSSPPLPLRPGSEAIWRA